MRVRKDLVDYITSILTYNRNTGLATTKTRQILLVYKHINKEFKRNIAIPLDVSIIASFISDLRRKKDI